MYNNIKFWIFAIVCFALFAIVYVVIDKSLSFRVILNSVLFCISIAGLIVLKKESRKKVNVKKNKINKKI